MEGLSAGSVGSLASRVAVPAYDRRSVRAGVVHLGPGAFHRAHQALFHERLLTAGHHDWGICGVGLLPSDRPVLDALRAQDGLYTLVEKHPDGSVVPRVVGSIVELLHAPDDPAAVIERLASPATRVVTLTITEGGYGVDDATGAFDPAQPDIVFGLVVGALRLRRDRGIPPFTVVSCDNLPGNGEIARSAFAGWAALHDRALAGWIRAVVSFPSSVVDRITPRTTADDRALVADLLGLDDRAPVVCEPWLQWVLERPACAELPPYEGTGVRFVDDARPYERMKLRLLNAGHQAIGHLGTRCGLVSVTEAMADPDVAAFLDAFLDREALPTVRGVPEVELRAFRGAIAERFANPAVGDTLGRLVEHADDRLPKFVLPVVRDRLARGEPVALSAAIVAAYAHCEGLDVVPAFAGDLAEQPGFAAPFFAALDTLERHGARAVMRAVDADGLLRAA